MSNVYFIGGAYMGCWYVRCFLPMIANKWKGSYFGLRKQSRKPPELVTKEILQSDVVVFHRANSNWHHRVGELCKQAGKKVVFDNDDTYRLDEEHAFFELDENGFKQNKEKVNNVINNFIFNSDLITCSTEFLADEYRKVNKNVVVLPNCVNPDDWQEPLRNEGDKVRIGIVGSTAYYHDFQNIKDVLKELDNNNKVQLVLFGLWTNQNNPLTEKVHHKEIMFWKGLKNKEHIGWVDMDRYIDTLNHLKLDMMIIPRRDNYFSRCKSNVKFLEAGMLEIPVIAQSFEDGNSPYDKDIDGTNGILVKDNSKWSEAIMDLVNNKEKRREIGKNAKKYVIENYDIKKHAHKWSEAYNSLFI